MIQISTTTSMYFINVTIRDLSVQQYLNVDTESSFTWVHARESDLYHYNPDASKTFRYMELRESIMQLRQDGLNPTISYTTRK